MLTPPKVEFNAIAKHPLVYALVILGLLVGYFVSATTGTSDERIKDCNEQIAYLRLQLSKKDSMLQDLQTELFISNNIIKSIPQTVDSLAQMQKRIRK